MRSETQAERGERVGVGGRGGGGWQLARRRANGVNVSADGRLSLCDGPAMNWPLVRGGTPPSLQDSWD